MAVPSSAYQSERAYFRNYSVSASYICKYTGVHSTVAQAKEKLKLDRLMEVRKNGTVYGFVGLVDKGSSNYRYHIWEKHTSGPTLRTDNRYYKICPGLMSLVCIGDGQITNIGGSTKYIYLNRATLNYIVNSTPYVTTEYTVYVDHREVASGSVYNGETASRVVNIGNGLSEGDVVEIQIDVRLSEYSNSSIQEEDYARLSVLPSITAITAMHLPSKNTMPDGSDWHQSVWIYSADLDALTARCRTLSMGSEGTTTYPKGGKIVTNLDRTGVLSEGYYAIDNNTGFRLISGNGGVIYRAFRPMGKSGTWIVKLQAVPSAAPSGSYGYRVNVVMSYTYSGTQPNYDPPSVSLRNFRIKASRNAGQANDQLAAEWQNGNTINDTLSISASKRTDSSTYIYFNKGFSTVYIGIVTSGWTVVSNPSGLSVSPSSDTRI